MLSDLKGNVTYVSRNPEDNNISYEELESKNIDLLVNTTPVGMYPNVDKSPVSKEVAQKAKNVVDIVFNPLKTRLLIDSNSSFHGLYMLVGQAIKAEEIWHNRRIDLIIEEVVSYIKNLYKL